MVSILPVTTAVVSGAAAAGVSLLVLNVTDKRLKAKDEPGLKRLTYVVVIVAVALLFAVVGFLISKLISKSVAAAAAAEKDVAAAPPLALDVVKEAVVVEAPPLSPALEEALPPPALNVEGTVIAPTPPSAAAATVAPEK